MKVRNRFGNSIQVLRLILAGGAKPQRLNCRSPASQAEEPRRAVVHGACASAGITYACGAIWDAGRIDMQPAAVATNRCVVVTMAQVGTIRRRVGTGETHFHRLQRTATGEFNDVMGELGHSSPPFFGFVQSRSVRHVLEGQPSITLSTGARPAIMSLGNVSAGIAAILSPEGVLPMVRSLP